MSINATLFVQAIVFLLLVLFTMKFVWPPIAKALDERAQKIADGLAAADRAKTELAAANQRVEKELSESRNVTASRLADAERRAQAIIEEAKARATEEGNKIVAAARAEAEQQSVKAREVLREQRQRDLRVALPDEHPESFVRRVLRFEQIHVEAAARLHHLWKLDHGLLPKR